jgi:hypothetical protein
MDGVVVASAAPNLLCAPERRRRALLKHSNRQYA